MIAQILAAALSTAPAAPPFGDKSINAFMRQYFDLRVAAQHCQRAMEQQLPDREAICEAYRQSTMAHMTQAKATSEWCLAQLEDLKARSITLASPEADVIDKCTAMHGLGGWEEFEAVRAFLSPKTP